jgi:ornithine cyclodeaminase/alanine dehydrogenase
LRVGLIGSGAEARMHAQAICRRHVVEKISVYSPTVTNRERLAAELREDFGVVAAAATGAREAVTGANCVVAAARSRDESPLLYADWLAAGTVVISVGSTTPSQREVDVSLIARAGLIVSDVPDELAHDTGDMRSATAAGIAFADKLAPLQDLVQGRVPPQRLDADLVMFKSVGSALQDIAFAEMVAQAARARGLGTVLGIGLSIKQSIGRNA